ncbi:indole-3-glycerol phosphate synthase TrpC [Anaeromicropila herbilytica]|uniref:Multifunctional fusion protein n=1 Tax=Anaeromicropila herbilytica TaxID=2785025 RepID=A0A7R7EP45_9FIRM|nr:indole-3-glycerol phosphate synthase TrpC [Anaeromicropila herbilytica]BCN32500.1 bifunctional indole-3-glycerol phosphate synthase/phosphoribosylanthranilate isomerase [Anaeromicropila herbilytica]
MILDDIVKDKRNRLIEHKNKISEEKMKEMALASKRISYSFYDALAKNGLSIIGEFKKASPSMGIIQNTIELMNRIDQYNQSVDAISCLTEEDHFHGSAGYLKEIREISSLPILRKDFIIDEYQIYEAKVIGADALLLIAAILDDNEMKRFYELSYRLGLDVLVEVHDEEEMERALSLGAKIIGVNNRNLKDFTISLDTTKKLKRMVPDEIIFVSESGVTTDRDIQYLKYCNVNALLIGRAFMESDQPMELANRWKSIYLSKPKVKICGLTSMEDAQLVNEAGVDYIGIVLFYPKSKRNCSLEHAKSILEQLDSTMQKVAVTVSPSLAQIEQIEIAGFDILQVHGDLEEKVLETTKLKILKAFNEDVTQEVVERLASNDKVIGFVVDATIPGSGKNCDWNKVRQYDYKEKLLVLAGGLTDLNVQEAIEIVHPDIVDVSSGVEKEYGIGKERNKIINFIDKVRN